MNELDGNALIDEVVKLTTDVRTDVTRYIQDFRDAMKKSDKLSHDFIDSTKIELEAKFKHYAETIQTSLIEYDLKNARRTEDILNSNRLLAAATIFQLKSIRENLLLLKYFIWKN